MPSSERGAVESALAARILVGTLLTVFVLLALVPGLVASPEGLRAGGPALGQPNASYVLGTDALGRDVWARLVFGARTSLAVGLLAVAIALTLGTLAGSLAAQLGGWWDDLIMRSAEISDSVPALLLGLLFVAVLGPGIGPIALVVGVTGWLGIARLVRAELMVARGLPYIVAARGLGAGRLRLAVRHLAPEVLIPLLALIPFRFEGAVIVEAGLSFLGIEDARRPSWGTMLRDAQPLLLEAWWLAAAPIVALALLLFALAMLGDWLQHSSQIVPNEPTALSVRSERRSTPPVSAR